jgi:hypothetical protein
MEKEERMNLTADQKQAIARGETVRLVDPDTEVECVVVRADVYERVKSLVYDDSPLSEEERLFAIREAGKRAGWDDSELDVYEQYREKE